VAPRCPAEATARRAEVGRIVKHRSGRMFFWAVTLIGAGAANEFFINGSGGPDTGQLASRLSEAEFNTPRQIVTVQASRELRSVRLATWNIDRGGDWPIVEAELQHCPADLLLLQEVDWNTIRSGGRDEAAELARRLQLNASYGIEFEELSQEKGESQAFIGQATLTRLPVRRVRVLRFEHQSGFWKPRSWLPSSIPLMQRRLGSRVALVSELDFDGSLLVVYNVHLESRSYGRIQAHQIDEIFADLKRYPAGTAVILGGDLNTKYFPSIFVRKLEGAGFQSSTGEQIERTHTIAMALDWIFAKGPVRLSGGGVRRDLRGSDHYPVFAELRRR
jgi:endonuclease/exonuclease/phosphatase family metal-dependent hydrolase